MTSRRKWKDSYAGQIWQALGDAVAGRAAITRSWVRLVFSLGRRRVSTIVVDVLEDRETSLTYVVRSYSVGLRRSLPRPFETEHPRDLSEARGLFLVETSGGREYFLPLDDYHRGVAEGRYETKVPSPEEVSGLLLAPGYEDFRPRLLERDDSIASRRGLVFSWIMRSLAEDILSRGVEAGYGEHVFSHPLSRGATRLTPPFSGETSLPAPVSRIVVSITSTHGPTPMEEASKARLQAAEISAELRAARRRILELERELSFRDYETTTYDRF